jgi:hypothetical protein
MNMDVLHGLWKEDNIRTSDYAYAAIMIIAESRDERAFYLLPQEVLDEIKIIVSDFKSCGKLELGVRGDGGGFIDRTEEIKRFITVAESAGIGLHTSKSNYAQSVTDKN